MSSTYGERRESSWRYGCPTILPKPQILQQVDTNIAGNPCQVYHEGTLSPFQQVHQGSYLNGQSNQVSSPFKKITGLKKTPHKKASSTISGLDSSYAEGGSENYYDDSQETTLSTTDASFAQFLSQQQSRQRQFNGSEGQHMNAQPQQQTQRKQRQAASLYSQAPVIQKITGIPYVSYRPYPQNQQISSETHLFDSSYTSPMSVSNKNQHQSMYDQQHMFQNHQQQYIADQQPSRQHHVQPVYNQPEISYNSHNNNNRFQLGRNQSDGSLLTFNGYDNQSEEQLSPLNNSRNSNESEGSGNNDDQNIHLRLMQQQQQQLQQQEREQLGALSQRNKRNHSMYAPQSEFNLDYKGINLAKSNNNTSRHQQYYPVYQTKSPSSCNSTCNDCNINSYHPNGQQSFQNLQVQQSQNTKQHSKQQQQQFFTGQPCYSHSSQQSNPICFQQYQSNPIPSSPIRTAYVQASNSSKNNASPMHLPFKPANPYSPNLYEVFGQHTNGQLTPQNHQTGLFSQCVTGSTVVHQSSGASMCQSSVLQNSSFLNNIPPQDNESSKNSSVLQIGSNFGSIKQNKSGFLNTQSSFINGFVRQSPPQIGLFQKCPQLQKIIDDLKDNIVKDLEILSDKLQKESEAIYYTQQNFHSNQQQEQLQEEQLQHEGVDLGEYSLGEDRKVRFSFSGKEVIAQISATNNKLNNKVSQQQNTVLSTFATPIIKNSTLSPMQQQIIASEIIANLPYDRLPESEALSTPRNPLESDTSSYLPTFSSPQRDADQNRHRNGSIFQDNVMTGDTKKEGDVQDKLFEQFFKSQNEEQEEEKKDEEVEQRVNSLEEINRLDSNKTKSSGEGETAFGKQTPQFENSKTKNCYQNDLTLNQTNSNTNADSSHNSQQAQDPSIPPSNIGRNSPQIEEFPDNVQSIAQNMISNGGLKNEILLSDHDDVVLRTDNTDQTSESSPKFTRLWDKNITTKTPFPIQFFQGKVPSGFQNPSSALDDIKEQQEIESADSTPKTITQPKTQEKTLSIQTSFPEINIESDSHSNGESSKTQIQPEQCPVYRGSTKSNSSSSSSGACRRYQDFSAPTSKQKIDSKSQLSNNSSAGNNLNNLPNQTELNYSSISSNTPRSSRYALTQKLQSYSSLKSSGNSQLNSSNNPNSSNKSLGEKVIQEKNTIQGDKQSDKESNLLAFRTAPCSPAYTPLVRFSTYLKQHQGELNQTQGNNAQNSQENQNKLQEKFTDFEKKKADDKSEYKNRDSDKGFFASILKRNHSILPMPVELAGNKALLYKSKSQATLFSTDITGNTGKTEITADMLVSKDNPLEQIRDHTHNQDTYSDTTANQFQQFLSPPSVPQSASKNESLQEKQIPNIYESTQKLMKETEITSKLKLQESLEAQSIMKDMSSDNHKEERVLLSEKKDSNEDIVLNSDENQQSNSQTIIMAECTPQKIKNSNDCENLNTNKHNGEDSSKEHKISTLPPKAPRVIISDKENTKQQQQQQQQFTQQCSSQSGGSSSKKKVKLSLELETENYPLHNPEQNSKKDSFVFQFDQPKDVKRNLSSELNQEFYSNQQSSPPRVMTPSRKREEQTHKLRKETSLEKDIQSNSNKDEALCQGLLNSSESSSSLLNIPQSESDPSFSKSQNHHLLRDKIKLAEGEDDTPPYEITISISNKNNFMNQSKTILKKSLIGSPTSSSRLNPGNSVKKSQRRISFKDNLEEVNYFEPEGKTLSTKSPNSKILLPRLKSRQEFKKEPYFNPIKKFPGIQNHPTFLQQYSSSDSSNMNLAAFDDKSPSKTIQEDLTPTKNIQTSNTNQEQKKTPLELGKNNDFKIPQLNNLNNITPTKQTLFKPLNFTPSGGSGKASKQVKLSFLEYSKIAKQQDQK